MYSGIISLIIKHHKALLLNLFFSLTRVDSAVASIYPNV